jgi:hypothetical protein
MTQSACRSQTKLDYLRTNMPAALVDKSRIKGAGALQNHDLPTAQGAASNTAETGEGAGAVLDENEIDALLDDIDDETALMAIRDARMQQLKQAASPTRKTEARTVRREGEVVHLECGSLVPVVGQELFAVVLLLVPGASSEGNEDAGSVLERHLKPLATESRGTCFAVTRMQGQEADDVRRALGVDGVPALVLLREGVIVRRICGGSVRQFVQMGPVGAAVLRAYLHEARVLCATHNDARARCAAAQSGVAQQRAARKRVPRVKARGNDESDDEISSDGKDDDDEEEEEEEEGWHGRSQRRSTAQAAFQSAAAAEVSLRESSSIRSISTANNPALRGSCWRPLRPSAVGGVQVFAGEQSGGACQDPACRHRTFAHQHIVPVGRRRLPASVPDAGRGEQRPKLHPHDTH